MAIGSQDITLFAGETKVITDTVRTLSTGALTSFTGATSIIFTLKQAGAAVLTKTEGSGITVISTGVLTVTLTAANTTSLLGEYQYEIRATLSDGTVTTFTTGTITVNPTLTA